MGTDGKLVVRLDLDVSKAALAFVQLEAKVLSTHMAIVQFAEEALVGIAFLAPVTLGLVRDDPWAGY